MNDILRRLGERIRQIRIERGFKSQEEFADYCKLHRTFVGHLETGRKDFRLTSIIRIAEALGATMEDLFAGLESDKPPKRGNSRRAQRLKLEQIQREVAALEHGIERLRREQSCATHSGQTARAKIIR